MVYTELALRRQQFHVAQAMQLPKSAISTPLPWILIMRAIKGYSHSLVCSTAENSYIKATNNTEVFPRQTDRTKVWVHD